MTEEGPKLYTNKPKKKGKKTTLPNDFFFFFSLSSPIKQTDAVAFSQLTQRIFHKLDLYDLTSNLVSIVICISHYCSAEARRSQFQ